MASSLTMGQQVRVDFSINETDTLAGTTYEMIAPITGFVTGLDVTVQKAVGTGGTVKVQTGASTDVAGATVTVADSATKGTRYSAEATAGSSTRAVTKGDRVQVVPASAFATTGAVNGHVTFSSAG